MTETFDWNDCIDIWRDLYRSLGNDFDEGMSSGNPFSKQIWTSIGMFFVAPFVIICIIYPLIFSHELLLMFCQKTKRVLNTTEERYRWCEQNLKSNQFLHYNYGFNHGNFICFIKPTDALRCALMTSGSKKFL